jgi:predicted DNA-binding protein with PD1-like motif
MKYSQAQPGRIFVIRLEDGEMIHEAVVRPGQAE